MQHTLLILIHRQPVEPKLARFDSFIPCFRSRSDIRGLFLLLSDVSESLTAYRYLQPIFFRQILLLVPYGTVSVKQGELFQIYDILPLLRIPLC